MHNRLRRLEQTVPELGCPACRGRRGRIVMIRAKRLPDDTLAYPDGRPAPCERCGKVPEFVVEIVEPAASASEEATAR